MDQVILAQKLESLRRCIRRVEQKIPADVNQLVQDPDCQDILVLNLTPSSRPKSSSQLNCKGPLMSEAMGLASCLAMSLAGQIPGSSSAARIRVLLGPRLVGEFMLYSGCVKWPTARPP